MPGPDTTTAELVAGFFLVCAALAAVVLLTRPIYMPLWHLFRRTQQFLEDWFGEPADARRGTKERPGAMARLAQLENNGGSTIKDTVEAQAASLAKLQHDVTNIRTGQELLLGQVDTATASAARAAQRAEDAAEQVREVADDAQRQRREHAAALDRLGADIAQRDEAYEQRAAERMADAFDLLAEVTMHRPAGPIIMRRKGDPVPPHAHELPQRVDPTLTGGPVQADAAAPPPA